MNEVIEIPRDYGQAMHPCGGGDHRVFIQRIRSAMHQRRPQSENAGVERDHVPGGGDLVRPGFDLSRLRRILFTRDLDTGLNLAQGDGG